MTRRFDIIAKAYPDHAQRIAEATYERSEISFNWLMKEYNDTDDAYYILLSSFIWSAVDEPFEYWYTLSERGGGVR